MLHQSVGYSPRSLHSSVDTCLPNNNVFFYMLFLPVSRFGLAVRRYADEQKDLASTLLSLKNKLWSMSFDFAIDEARKWLSSLSILMQESFSWRQCRVRCSLPLSPPAGILIHASTSSEATRRSTSLVNAVSLNWGTLPITKQRTKNQSIAIKKEKKEKETSTLTRAHAHTLSAEQLKLPFCKYKNI